MKIITFCLVLFFAVSYLLSAKEYNIMDFGATTDTSILSTQAIQKAIDACSQSGSGQVIIPAGSFLMAAGM